MNTAQEAFVRAFIVPGERDRYLQLLASPSRRQKILGVLYHNLDVISERATRIENRDHTSERVEQLLRVKGAGPTCYLISPETELNQQEMPLREALETLIDQDGTAIACCLEGRLAYYKPNSANIFLSISRKRRPTMSALAALYVTPEQYLEAEREADFKSEYFSGQIFAMAGGTPEHSAIGTNIAGELRSRLRGKPCQVYNSDLRVTVMQSGLKTYPDVTVVCGEQYFHPLDTNSLINPTVIIEVLSGSTESYDRGAKWTLYQGLDSLQEYVLVSVSTPRIERFTRQDNGLWLYESVGGVDGEIRLESLEITLPLAEVYERVVFSAPPEPGATQAHR